MVNKSLSFPLLYVTMQDLFCCTAIPGRHKRMPESIAICSKFDPRVSFLKTKTADFRPPLPKPPPPTPRHVFNSLLMKKLTLFKVWGTEWVSFREAENPSWDFAKCAFRKRKQSPANHLPSLATWSACKYQSHHPCFGPISAVTFPGLKETFGSKRPALFYRM